MSTQDVTQMEAGPEMDALVAKRVMGWDEWLDLTADAPTDKLGPIFFARWDNGPLAVYRNDGGSDDADSWFAPSRDIADAWLVVERMHERGWQVVLNGQTTGYPWLASMAKPFPWITAHAETPAEAICRAALLAVSGSPS